MASCDSVEYNSVERMGGAMLNEFRTFINRGNVIDMVRALSTRW
jgi:hypothetical protein